MISCNPKTDCTKELAQHKSDSVSLVNAKSENERLIVTNENLRDSIKSFKKENCDTLRTQLLLSNFKIEKVRYYLKIVNNNKTQEVFLRGWITRAVE